MFHLLFIAVVFVAPSIIYVYLVPYIYDIGNLYTHTQEKVFSSVLISYVFCLFCICHSTPYIYIYVYILCHIHMYIYIYSINLLYIYVLFHSSLSSFNVFLNFMCSYFCWSAIHIFDIYISLSLSLS